MESGLRRGTGLRRTGVAAGLAVVLGVALTGCSGSSTSPADPTSSATSATSSAPPSSSSPSKRASGDPSPTQAPSRGTDPTIGTYKPVKRPGGATRSVSAAPQPFDGSIRYGDGIRLAVTDVVQSKSTAQGPGAFPGEPVTRISVALTNGSPDRLDLNRVVVTALYGSAGRQARAVYDARSRDFSGTVKPGARATAVYAFSVPTSQLRSVRMVVDFDGRHTVATFRGDPRTAD